MATYFISDLHLAANAPAISQRFADFLQHDIQDADSLYILGDLFEYWIGDDAAAAVGMQPVLEQLQQLTQQGIKGYFIAGNRDFLVNKTFAATTGFSILADFSIIDLYGTPTLLLHGDALCTDDTKHQTFREQIMTNTAWHAMALEKSIEERIAIAEQLRGMSAEHKMSVSDAIMDVNADSVVKAFEQYGVKHMIHGHTHRPNIHQHQISSGSAERIVLGDWYTQHSFLRVDEQGYTHSNAG